MRPPWPEGREDCLRLWDPVSWENCHPGSTFSEPVTFNVSELFYYFCVLWFVQRRWSARIVDLNKYLEAYLHCRCTNLEPSMVTHTYIPNTLAEAAASSRLAWTTERKSVSGTKKRISIFHLFPAEIYKESWWPHFLGMNRTNYRLPGLEKPNIPLLL